MKKNRFFILTIFIFIILIFIISFDSIRYNEQKYWKNENCDEKNYFSQFVIENHNKFIKLKDTSQKIEHYLINTCYYQTNSYYLGLRIKLFINSNDIETNENYFFEELFKLQNELENYCKIEEISCLVYNEQVKDKYSNNNFYLSIECNLNKNTYKTLKTGFDLEKYFYFIHGTQLEILY